MADLLSMTWSHGELRPSFDPAVHHYSIVLPKSVESINVKFSVANDRYWVFLNVDGYSEQFLFDNEPSIDFNLTFGDNVFTVEDELASIEGSDAFYYVTITRVEWIPEPSPNTNVQVCEDVYQLLVNLIADQYENNFECAALSTRVFAIEESGSVDPITTDEMCDCYVLSPTDLTYTYMCSLVSTQQYSIAAMAQMCNGDIGPTDEGITELQLVEQIGYDFDESTWEGNAAGTNDPEMSIWWGMRQTFNVTDPSGNGKYLFSQFTTDIRGNWSESDGVIFGVNYLQDWTYYHSDLTEEPCVDPCQTTVLVALDQVASLQFPGTYTVTIDSTLNGLPTEESFIFSMDTLGILSENEVAKFCANINANKENTVYPMFVHDDSRFYLSPLEATVEDKARLKLSITVPRGLYEFEIDFQDATSGLAGYDGDRAYDFNTDELSETYWLSEGIVDSNDPCGAEKWVAYIPWEVFGPDGGAGGVELLEQWNNGTHVISDDGIFLNYGSELVFSGKEWVSQTEGGRTWDVEKSLVWRMPFVVRFQRIVYTEIDVTVPPAPYEILIVAAITNKIQSNTLYTLNTNQQYYAKFDFEIRTRIQYPYMLVSGNATDDPPMNWLNINTPDVFTDPLTEDGHDWHPAQVIYSPDFSGLEVAASLTFKSEDSASCTYVDHTHITDNYDSVCEQYWNLELIPSATSCFASGTYAVTWTVRCFYDKPVCYFENSDQGTNSATVVFDIETTRICPVLVMDVDAEGVICSTGRERYYMCDDYAQQYPVVGDASPQGSVIDTYFQNDIVHFFMEVDSAEARIIYTRIYQIWATQDMSGLAGTSVLYDLDFEEVKLYDYGSPVTEHVFQAEGSTDSQTVSTVILETMNSNDFAAYSQSGFTVYGTGPTDEGLYSGFQVRLDPLVFPVLTDSQQDVTFTVILDIFYEGWGRQKTEGQDFDDNADPLGRRTLRFNTRSRKQGVEENYVEPSGTHQLTPQTSIAIKPPTGDFIHCFRKATGIDAWSLELALTDQQMDSWKADPAAFEAEFVNTLTYVLGAKENQIELTLLDDSHPSLSQSGSNALALFKVRDTLASHSSASLYNHLELLSTSQLLYSQNSFFDNLYIRRGICIDIDDSGFDNDELTQCVFGQPCSILGDTLAGYLETNGQDDQLESVNWMLDPNSMTSNNDAQSSSLSLTIMLAMLLLLIAF